MLGFPLLFQLYALFLAVPYYSKNYASIMCTSLIMGTDWQKLNDGVKMKDDHELELCHDPVMSQSLYNRQHTM